MVKFEIYGPYDIPKATKGNPIPMGIKKYIWEKWEEDGCPVNMPNRVGCYVFAIRSSQGALIPYYVGRATKSYKSEIFTSDKLIKYNNSVLLKNFGTPIMLFVSYPQKPGQKNFDLIEEVEAYLIGLVYKKNPDGLENIHGAKDKSWDVQGLKQKGKPSKALEGFRRLFNLKI